MSAIGEGWPHTSHTLGKLLKVGGHLRVLNGQKNTSVVKCRGKSRRVWVIPQSSLGEVTLSVTHFGSEVTSASNM